MIQRGEVVGMSCFADSLRYQIFRIKRRSLNLKTLHWSFDVKSVPTELCPLCVAAVEELWL